MLKWRSPLLGGAVVRGLLPEPLGVLLMVLLTKAAAFPISSLTFFICGMAAVEEVTFRFVLAVFDDMIGKRTTLLARQGKGL